MAKDPYRGTPAIVRIVILSIALVDVHVIVITVTVHGVASYMMKIFQFTRSRDHGLLTKIKLHSYLRVKNLDALSGSLFNSEPFYERPFCGRPAEADHYSPLSIILLQIYKK